MPQKLKRDYIGLTISVVGRPIINWLLKDSHRCRVIVTCKDEVLLVRGRVSSQLWSLPGGGMHRQETVEQAGIREVKEEVGLTLAAGSLQELDKSVYRKDGRKIYNYHLLHAKTSTKRLRIRRSEIIEAQWFKLSDLPQELSYFTANIALPFLRKLPLLRCRFCVSCRNPIC